MCGQGSIAVGVETYAADGFLGTKLTQSGTCACENQRATAVWLHAENRDRQGVKASTTSSP